MNIKLSICIATRNRGAFIGETIRSIAIQSTDAVEIVVLDGASTDNTGDVIRALQQTMQNLRYVRQDTNGGVDRDYNVAVHLASGEYCWLMSDDDLLKPGAIDAVLSGIERRYSLIIVNAELRDLTLSHLLDAKRLQLAADRIYGVDEFERLFEETSGYLAYIGAVVIRRDIWLSRHAERYFGTYFIHVGVIFEAPLPGETLVLSEPYISVRFGNTQWRPKEFEIRMIRWTELIASLTSITDGVRERNYRLEPWKSLKSLLFYRAKGTYDMSDYRRWVAPRLRSPIDKARALAVVCMPGVLANAIGLLYCRLGYRDSNIHLLDMKASRFFYRNWLRKV